MHEEVLRSALHQTVDKIELPPGIWNNIQNRLYNRPKKWSGFKKAVAIAAGTTLFCITSIGSITSAGAEAQGSWLFKNKLGAFTLTIVQNVGKELAQITPTLFLPTTLSHAKQVAKMPIRVPTYLPAGISLGANTPTLVGRFGSYETVAIKVLEKVDGSDAEKIFLDIRQTTAKDLNVNYPPDVKITSEKIKISNIEGVIISGDAICPMLYWTDGKYFFRMFGPRAKDELLKIAESMK